MRLLLTIGVVSLLHLRPALAIPPPKVFELSTLKQNSLCINELLSRPSKSNSESQKFEVLSPIDLDDPKTKWFNFVYEWFPPKTPDRPTIVILSGGPGIGNIGRWKTRKEVAEYFGLRREDGILLFDPRTVDQNGSPRVRFSKSSLTSKNLNEDYRRAIRRLGLKNYVLYGNSYGTVSATLLAHALENDGAGPPPQRVLLSGTVGPAILGGVNSIAEGTKKLWELIFPRLSPIVQDRLLNEKNPFGMTAKELGLAIEAGFYTGGEFDSKNQYSHVLVKIFSKVGPPNSKNDKKIKEALLDLTRDDLPNHKWGDLLYKTINCRELTDQEPETALKKGKIVALKSKDPCRKKVDPLSLPYFPKNYPIQTPIIYLQGEYDPATTVAQAIAHFYSQPQAPRVMMLIPQGGHGDYATVFSDCINSIWTGLLSQTFSDFASHLKKCKITRIPGFKLYSAPKSLSRD